MTLPAHLRAYQARNRRHGIDHRREPDMEDVIAAEMPRDDYDEETWDE